MTGPVIAGIAAHFHDSACCPLGGGRLVAAAPRIQISNQHSLCSMIINMKAIQVTLDDRLLARLDADEEVRRDGRSAVLRRAADEYLRKRRRRAVAEQYANAYASRPGLGTEFSGWEDEGAWPER